MSLYCNDWHSEIINRAKSLSRSDVQYVLASSPGRWFSVLAVLAALDLIEHYETFWVKPNSDSYQYARAKRLLDRLASQGRIEKLNRGGHAFYRVRTSTQPSRIRE